MLYLKKTTYRKRYLKLAGIEPIKGIEVHHIDENRANNCVFNLVAIDKEIHSQLHKLYWEYPSRIHEMFGERVFKPKNEVEELVEKAIQEIERDKTINKYEKGHYGFQYSRALSEYRNVFDRHNKIQLIINSSRVVQHKHILKNLGITANIDYIQSLLI